MDATFKIVRLLALISHCASIAPNGWQKESMFYIVVALTMRGTDCIKVYDSLVSASKLR